MISVYILILSIISDVCFSGQNKYIQGLGYISMSLYVTVILIPHFEFPSLDTTDLMLHILDATPSLLNIYDVLCSCYLSYHS